MNKLVTTTLEHRTVALVCSSIAILLSACGGGDPAATDAAHDRTAAVMVSGSAARGASGGVSAAATGTAGAANANSAANGADAEAADAEAADDEAADNGGEAGPEEASPPDAGSFAVSGYAHQGGPDSWQESYPDGDSAVTPAAASLYVSLLGKDTNAGSAEQPFRTIARAAQAARPGTTVYVAPGIYAGGFQTTADGSANARIAYVSTRRWGAKIVPPKNSRNDTAWDNRGDYVDIVGFNVDGRWHGGGTRWTHGIYNGGSYDRIMRNHVQFIAKNAACTSAGGSAIGVDSYYRGVKSHVLANLVHDIGPTGCRYVQGIYFSTTGSVKNNVVHRVAEGAIHLWHDARDVIITNNTAINSNTGIIVGGGDYYHSSGPNDNTSVFSNIVYGNRMGISEQGQTGRNNRYRNNLVYGNSTYNFRLNNGLSHSGTVSQAPMFVRDNKGESPDLSLRSGSPAIGNASASEAEGTDFNGRARNARTGYDIGAYQHF